jgi:hypothetical protein
LDIVKKYIYNISGLKYNGKYMVLKWLIAPTVPKRILDKLAAPSQPDFVKISEITHRAPPNLNLQNIFSIPTIP